MAKGPITYADLDEIDRKIVDFLRTDGRIAFREIARKLDISEGMVRKRVKKLLDSGFIYILAVSDPLKLGVPVLAATTLKVSPGAVEELTDRLAEIDNVRYVALGVGAKEVMIESLHKNVKDLHTFLTEVIGSMPSVISTETFQVVRIKKSIWDWSIPIAEEDLTNKGR